MMCLPSFRRLGGPFVAALLTLTPALLCLGDGSALADGPVISPFSGLLQVHARQMRVQHWTNVPYVLGGRRGAPSELVAKGFG